MSLKNLKCGGCDKFLHKIPGQKKKIETEDEAIYFVGNRCCRTHLFKNRVHSNSSNLSATELKKMIENISIKCNSTLYDKIGDFIFMLQIEYEQLISEYSTEVLKSFEEDVLPYRFGITSSIRDDLIQNHTTKITKNLFDIYEHLFLICDGTYVRHQKSSNNEFQRKTYSGQKKLWKENDILVLDRGFRDMKDKLELKKIRVLMHALKEKCKQLTTKKSNESRYVTKICWAVEAVHGIIKQKYRLLDYKLDNKMLPKIGTYFRIASFFNNQPEKEQSNVLKLQVPSCHINWKIYRCFLKYKPNNVGISGLLQYACDYENRGRTVGCCSHVASIVYYLAHARYLSKIFKPAEILSKMFQQNSIIPIIEDDSDED
ncbi:hypothetical protein ACFW04_007420 [Cataglyphis niger]